MLEKGAYIEQTDSEGRSPLHYVVNSAQKGGTRQCLKLLVDKGANIDQKDNMGMTPVHIAAFNVKASRLEYLISAGADLCIRNNAKQSGLFFAMKYLPHVTTSALETRLNRSIYETDLQQPAQIKLDFGMLLPPSTVNIANPPRSEVELFVELLPFQRTDVEKILLHPLPQ